MGNPVKQRVCARAAVTATVAGLAMTLAACAPNAVDPGGSGSSDMTLSGDVVWADYGGPTNESRYAAYFDSFATETGVDVISTSFEDAIAFGMLDGGQGDYDLLQVSTDSFLAYQANILELPDDVPRGDNLPENIRDYAVGGFTIGIAQGWLTETFSDGGPQDWADFFDLESYPGNRAWPGSPGSYDASYELALLADGVAPHDLYPIDFDRAEAKLDTIRDELVYYTSYPEVQTLLANGSASIAVSVTGQFTALLNQGLDVSVQWNEAFLSPNFFVVPATAPNLENAFALAAWLADPEREAIFIERTRYIPANTQTLDLISEDTADSLPDESSGALYFDEEWRSEHQDEFAERYTAWLSR